MVNFTVVCHTSLMRQKTYRYPWGKLSLGTKAGTHDLSGFETRSLPVNTVHFRSVVGGKSEYETQRINHDNEYSWKRLVICHAWNPRSYTITRHLRSHCPLNSWPQRDRSQCLYNMYDGSYRLESELGIHDNILIILVISSLIIYPLRTTK
jgi:hypothetical protein